MSTIEILVFLPIVIVAVSVVAGGLKTPPAISWSLQALPSRSFRVFPP